MIDNLLSYHSTNSSYPLKQSAMSFPIISKGNSFTQDLPPTNSEANTPSPSLPLPSYLAYLLIFTPIYPHLIIFSLHCSDLTICAIFTIHRYSSIETAHLLQDLRAIGQLITQGDITFQTRQSEMANTSPRHMPVLGNVHPH